MQLYDKVIGMKYQLYYYGNYGICIFVLHVSSVDISFYGSILPLYPVTWSSYMQRRPLTILLKLFIWAEGRISCHR